MLSFATTSLMFTGQPIPDGTKHIAEGHWEEVGNGSQTNTNGTVWDGNYANLKQGTWVWEPESTTATISYRDDTNGQEIQFGPDFKINGWTPNRTIKVLVGDDVDLKQAYLDAKNGFIESFGYELVGQDGTVPVIYTIDGFKITVHFKDKMATETQTDNGSLTIHYKDANGNTIAPDKTVSVGYARTGTKDLARVVTLQKPDQYINSNESWTNWTPEPDENVTIQSPEITGYTPDKARVSDTIARDAKDNVDVVYTANAEKATVNYVDQDNNDSVIKSVPLDGKFGEKSGYTTQEEIAALEAEGYELVSDGYPVGYTFNTDNPTFTVVLKHKTKNITPDNPGTPSRPVDPNNPDGPKYPDGTGENDLVKTITRTIHYKDEQGRTVSKDVVETTKFSCTATFDEVTGKVTYSAWNPTNDTFIEVDSPVVDGYYTDTAKVGAETINVYANNSEVTVLYHPMGHLVPDVPGTTPVPYPNDPTNPSDAGNPIIPNIPGYTPVDPNGNKMTPVTPSTPAQPAEKPNAPATPVKNDSQEPSTQKAQNAEATKVNVLPQTGQDASTSLMSVIGMILLAILGLFGLDGFKKRNENK